MRFILTLVIAITPLLCFGQIAVMSETTLVKEAVKPEAVAESENSKVTEKTEVKPAPKKEFLPVVIDGDEITYLQQKGKIVAKGNVELKYKGVELYCQEAEFDANSNIANINGDVKIVRENSVLYGRDIVYNFNTFKAQSGEITMHDPPLYGFSQNGSMIGKEKYVFKNGHVTTCDLTKPHYRLTAKKMIVFPGQRVVAKNVVLRVGKIPMFYLPYISQSLKDESFITNVVPGKSDEWGVFVLTRWRYTLNLENRGNIFTDWYGKRGWGLGVTHKVQNTKYGEALIKYYGIQDVLYKDEANQREELFDVYPLRSGIDPKRLEDDRYKAQLSYSWEPNPNLSIRSEYHRFSDDNFMKDFFEREYEIEPDPLTYALINYSLENSSLSLLGQKRVNNFWSQTEYLPQLEYDFYNQSLGSSRFYFESNNKLGNINIVAADTRLGDSAGRYYSENTLSYIDKIKWLKINPYIGAFTTVYSRNKYDNGVVFRVAPKVGVNLSTKVYKTFGAGWNIFGEKVKEARHIITPEIEYSYVHDPTISDNNLIQFDDADSLSRDDKIKFTLKNKLQARNESRTWDFLYFSPSVEYQINPEGGESRFTTVTADFEIYPKEGLSLTADTSYDVDTRRVSAFNADVTYRKKAKFFLGGEDVEKDKYSVTYGHRYERSLNNNPGSTLGALDFSYQLTPKLQLRNYLRYEYNTGDLEEQQYKIRTDLHCWWLDLGVDLNRRDEGSKDITYWVTFTLKAFPDISFDIDQGREGAKKTY